MQHIEKTAAHCRIALLLTILALTACGGDRGTESETATEDSEELDSTPLVETGDDYGLTAKIRGDRSYERTWIEPEVEKIATLSEGEEYTLYNPFVARIPSDGRIYVLDGGDYTVKAFTPEGEYVATYGRGQGRGPGELMSMSHVDVWQDSLVYVVDQDQRRVSFFEKDGDFVRTESSEIPLFRVVWANGPTKYGLVMSPYQGAPFMIIESSGRRRTISQLSSQDVEQIALQGRLHAHGERAVFVPHFFPVILSFSADDTTGVAIPTPDYGHPRPKAEREEGGLSAPPWRFNLKTTLSEGMLSVGRANPDGDNLLFDLYDVQEMEYVHSLRLPIKREKPRLAHLSLYAHGLGIVASVQGATVEIYEVHHSEQ